MYGKKSLCERFAVCATRCGKWDAAIVLCVDGPVVSLELDNSIYPEDWITGLPPDSGMWVWEGYGYESYRMWEGDYSDPVLEGSWRRPTAVEMYKLSRGESLWADPVAAAG